MKFRLPILPTMRCDDHCGMCCGIAPCTQSEFDKIANYIKQHSIKPVNQFPTCPLYLDGKCSVYPVRPVVCRIFGHDNKLVCPHGYNTNDPDVQEAIDLAMTRYPTPTRHTQEFVSARTTQRFLTQ